MESRHVAILGKVLDCSCDSKYSGHSGVVGLISYLRVLHQAVVIFPSGPVELGYRCTEVVTLSMKTCLLAYHVPRSNRDGYRAEKTVAGWTTVGRRSGLK